MTASDGTRWKRVKKLFEAAVDLGPQERASLLDDECDGDHALRREVASLLAADREAGDFIEQPPFELPRDLFPESADETFAGRQIGAYKVIREIGRGGLGAVYLASRADDEYRKEVAIKLVRRGLDTDDILRRFRNERQILAQLDHPNIARLFDGGTTDDGVPYFVMEYVNGDPIGAYCDANALTSTDRLNLFRKVCAAVTYAHQNLVIHRDLKPSNILVTREGEPKLLDFGIAKLLGAEEDALAQTMAGQEIMTPEYASPEQVKGEKITTASDVYSLGVLLYELLTGQRPYRLKTRTAAEVARAITDQEPERPSTCLTRGDLSPSSILHPRFLRGDLDNIVLMAMRKEPARRYASVGQFSEDIRRHLEGLPVAAHKDTVPYRTRKFVRRHRVAVIAACLVFLAVIGGMIATLWGWRVARSERRKAQSLFSDVRQLANSFMFEFHDSIQDLPGSTAARALVVKRALEYLDRLAQKSAGDPTLERELATAYRRVGDVQGNPNNANLGDTAGAMQSYDKALAIAKELAGTDRADVETQRLLAVIYQKLAEVQAATGDLKGGVESSVKSLGFFKQFADTAPTDIEAQRSLAVSHIKLGDVLGNSNFPNVGDWSKASSEYQSASKILESVQASGVADERTRRLLGIVYERMGTMQEAEKNFAEALETYRKSLAIREALATEFPNHADVVRDAAIAQEKIGNAMTALGNLNAALENRRNSLEIFQKLARSDSKNVQAQRSVAISYTHLGDLLGNPESPNLGKLSEALENYRKALEIYLMLDAAVPSNSSNRKYLAELYASIGTVNAKLAATAANALDRDALIKQARRSYYQSLETWLDLQTQGRLSEADTARIDKLRATLAKSGETGNP